MPVRGFYINLDRSDARRAEAEREVQKLAGLGAYQRFSAVDGAVETRWPAVPNRGELGCFLSHLEVIRQNVGFDGWLHVVEDDVVVSRYAAPAIAAITGAAELDQFDVIFTNAMFGTNPWFIAALREQFDANVVTAPSGDVTAVNQVRVVPFGANAFFTTTSYLVNPRVIGRTAQLLAGQLEAGSFAAVDVVFSGLSRGGQLRVGCTVPFLTMQRLAWNSTIRDHVSLWAVSQYMMMAAIFADRDMGELRALFTALRRSVAGTPTSELLGEAHRLMFAGGFEDIVQAG
ncbi:MAG TPA: glycosyltransferase family 25 protein [Caulobacteraceae bacterium]|nr:glycosyltransferase family 25 protein [Caulobacteraceae bacterium]